eukprot:279099_1
MVTRSIILLLFIVFNRHTQSTPIISGELDCSDEPTIGIISSDEIKTHYYSFAFPDLVQKNSVIIFSTCHDDTSLDTQIKLFDNNMTQIANNDNSEQICSFNKNASTLMIDYTTFPDDTYYVSVSYYNDAANWFYNGTFAIDVKCVPISSTAKCGNSYSGPENLFFGSITNDTELYVYTMQVAVNEQVRFTTCNPYTLSFHPIILLYDSYFNLLNWNNKDNQCNFNSDAATLVAKIKTINILYIFVTYFDYPYSLDNGDFGLKILCYSDANPLKCNNSPLVAKTSDMQPLHTYPFILPPQYNSAVFTTCTNETYADASFVIFDDNTLLHVSDPDKNCPYAQSTSTLIINNNLTHNKVYNVRVGSNQYLNYGLKVICYQYKPVDKNVSLSPTTPRSCDKTDADTCYINITSAIDHSISGLPVVCDTLYPNCIITINIRRYPNFYCPPDCNKCTIHCVNDMACNDVKMYGTDCQLMKVNFNGNINGEISPMVIAPQDYGDLEVVVHDGAAITALIIGAYNDTKNIILDVSKDGHIPHSLIAGNKIAGDLNISCKGYCNHSTVLCPGYRQYDHTDEDSIDSIDEDTHRIRCNIDCSSSNNVACKRMEVMSAYGVRDVNWHGCNNSHSTACKWAFLYCIATYDVLDEVFTQWVWDNASGWQYGNANCDEIEAQVKTKTEDRLDIVITVSIISVILLILIVVVVVYYYKYQRDKKSMYINNAMVIAISIGIYDQEPENSQINGYFVDLDGVEHDIKNMVDLFHKNLNYDVYPEEYIDATVIKTHWKEAELKVFLEKKAQYLEENITQNKKYDGLIVVFSCHGIPDYIVTSDYHRFSKLALHRIFSSTHPESRKIPRVFIFDCCSGSSAGWVGDRDDAPFDTGKNITLTSTEKSKNVEIEDIHDDEEIYEWANNEDNPDFRLATIMAANPGYQSKLRSDYGSYVINGFYEKEVDNFKQKKRKFIHEIFDDIQTELHNKGKQHPVYVWNDGTRYIQFKRNDYGDKNDESKANGNELEMTTKMSIENHETKNIDNVSDKYNTVNSDTDNQINESENVENIDEMMEILDELDDKDSDHHNN